MARQVRLRRPTKYNVDTSRIGKAARTVDGITFASKAEARRYQVLKARELAGEIRDLELQPRSRSWRASHRGNRSSVTTPPIPVPRGRRTVIERSRDAKRSIQLRKKLFSALWRPLPLQAGHSRWTPYRAIIL